MKKHNILFLFSDQHRGDWLPYDDETRKKLNFPQIPLRMDNVRKLMDRGVTFTNCVTNSPLCAPARACLASGMQYERCGVYNNYFCYPLDLRTFYNILRDDGYDVRGVGKFDLHKPIFYWGCDGWIDQLGKIGFSSAIDSEGKYDLVWSSFYGPRGPYSKYLSENGWHGIHVKDYIRRYLDANDVAPTPLPDEAYADNWVMENAIEQLEQLTSKDEPWFLMVNFSGPHNPWDVTVTMKESCKDRFFPIPSTYTGDSDVLNSVMRNYAAMLENIDKNIGVIINKLHDSGQLEDTIVIYSADHGEMMGEHDRYMKSVPFQGALRIPLVVAGPEVLNGKVRNEMVQLHDLAATITDFAGLDMPEEADAISLKGLASDEAAQPIRDYQVAMLCNSRRSDKPLEGYEDLEQYRNTRTDDEYIEEFNETLKMDLPKKVSMKKYAYGKDWGCIIYSGYKLIEFSDGSCELYDLIHDPEEKSNIAMANESLVLQIRSKYKIHLQKES